MSKAVLYLAGGGMSGVFGSGIVSVLERSDSYHAFEAVYGASAGAWNAAYFLARQAELGSSIYFEEMRHGFLSGASLAPGALQRLVLGPIFPRSPDHYINAMHIGYLKEVVTGAKALDLDRIERQRLPFYVKVFNQHSHEVEYHEIHRVPDPLGLLLASAALPPYTFAYQLYRHHRMIDSCIAEVIGLAELKRRHPESKIVIALNRRPRRALSNRLVCRLEAIISAKMYGPRYYWLPLEREEEFRVEYEEAKRLADVLVVAPRGEGALPGTTDLARLRAVHHQGERAAKRILDFIEAGS